MTSGRFYILLIFITGIVSLELAAAPAAGLEIDDVKVGIADRYKLGRWTPVRFVLNAGDQPWRGSLRISARDGDDAWATLTGGSLSDISLAAGESRQMETYVRIGRQSSDLRIAAQPAEDAGGELIEFVSLPDGLLASQQSILVIGGDVGLRSALRVMPRRTNEEILGTTVEKSDELPNRWFGYDGFDVLVLTTTDDTLYAALSSQQTEAIADWVELGGRLIVTLGASGEEFLQQPTLIGRFTPGDYVRTLPLRQVSALEAYVESSMSLGSTEAGDVRLPPLVTQLTNLQGEVVLSSGRDVPLLVRSAAGFGSVLFVAMDLDAAPLADWEDRHRLLAKLLELSLSESPASETQQVSGEAAHLGFDDLAGQLNAALQVFDGVTMLSFSAIAALIMLYVLLIGPLDFWLVRYVLKRPELTWVTSAALVAIFCGLAWWLAGRIRGDSPHLNQIDIVDVDAATQRMRGTSWLHLYSPASRSFDISPEPHVEGVVDADTAGILLTWQGSPGKSLGGMNRQSRPDHSGGEYLLADVGSAQRPDLTVRDLSLAAAGSKALCARWWADARALSSFKLQEIDGQKLAGHIENPLSVRLTNCSLYYDRWVYQLGNLEPGQRVNLDVNDSPRDSQWALTERRFVDNNDVSTPWDQAMRDDVPKIIRMLMFHEVAGGRRHTDLLHRYYGYLDMSDHLQFDRAILVGMAEEPALQTTTDNENIDFADDRRWTFCRIVFPTSKPD